MQIPRRTPLVAFLAPGVFTPAVAAVQPNPAGIGIGITVLVLLTMTASAWLPLVAYRHWTGAWRKVALAPLLLLLLWVVAVLAHRAVDPSAHPMWQLELFAGAMLMMVYMVAAFTIKSILNKSDASR